VATLLPGDVLLQDEPGKLLFRDEMLDGPPPTLLLGEEVGVALLMVDDCTGDMLLFWCTDNEDLLGVLLGVITDICDGTLEGPGW
jgi:hypothetical protein